MAWMTKKGGHTTDMTVGSPLKLIGWFALPIVAGNMFQQLYSLVDSVVIGRVEGVTALAAVSAAGWMDWTILGVAMGITQGCSILIAQHFGAGDEKALKRTVGQSILLAVVTALVLAVLAQVLIYPVLRLMNSPEDTIHLSALYLRLLFAGFPMVMGYNLTASFLRALGDGRTPLIAMALAAFLNIVLDILLVAGFSWGVAGAAIATVMAQSTSFIYCLLALRKLPQMHPAKGDMRPEGAVLRHLIRLGAPMAMASAVISIGGMTVQSVTNGYGVVFMAGASAAGRLTGIAEVAGSSLGTAMGTYMGQNIGAKRLDRVKLGLRRGAQLGVVLALGMGTLLAIFGKPLMRMFVEDDPALVDQVLTIGYQYLCVMSACLFTLYLLFVYRSSLQGLGQTVIPMFSGFAELAMRILVVLTLPRLIGYWGVYIAEVSAWIGAMVLLIWGYYRHIHRLERQGTYHEV